MNSAVPNRTRQGGIDSDEHGEAGDSRGYYHGISFAGNLRLRVIPDMIEKLAYRRALDQPALMDEQHLVTHARVPRPRGAVRVKLP